MKASTGTKEWNPSGKYVGKYSGKSYVVDKTVSNETVNTAKTEESTPSVFELVYGKLPYALFVRFTEVLASNEGDPMELLYGKVTYAEFRKIEEVLKNV